MLNINDKRFAIFRSFVTYSNKNIMKTRLLLLLLFIATISYGQTITVYYTPPSSMYDVVQPAAPLNHDAGPWSFSFTDVGNSSDSHRAPNSSELADFPGTTSVSVINRTIGSEVTEVTTFTKNNSGEISITGSIGAGLTLDYELLGAESTIIDDNGLIGTFPLSSTTENVDNIEGEFLYSDGLTIGGTFTGTISTQLDANNTLVISVGGSEVFNGTVTRLKVEQTINLVVTETLGGVATQVSYFYYDNSTSDLVLRETSGTITSPIFNDSFVVIESLDNSSLNTNTIDISKAPFDVFPNPANDYINFNVGDLNVKDISIYDITGRRVLTEKISANNSVSIKHLKAGIYVVSAVTEKGMLSKRFIKK